MESTGAPMAIQASQAVVDDAGMSDAFCHLGERLIKGKGIMPTYLYKVSKKENKKLHDGKVIA